MNIFISWSGERSQLVAQLLKRWLKCVLQATEPWISSEDIERGSMWFQDISNSLGNCNIGIICLTKENLYAPWILFESGCLLKGLSSNRVCTLLVDLEPKDVTPPLSQFNHTFPTKQSMYKLVSMLNERLEYGKLDERTLDNVFDTYWASFDKDFYQILETTDQVAPTNTERTEKDVLTEILYTVRSVEQQLKKVSVESPQQLQESTNSFLWEDAPTTLDVSSTFEKDDLVIHKIFGFGRVEDVRKMMSDIMLTVSFDSFGTKRMMCSVVQNKKLMFKIKE